MTSRLLTPSHISFLRPPKPSDRSDSSLPFVLACFIFSSQAIVNIVKWFSVCWLAVNLSSDLCQSCHENKSPPAHPPTARTQHQELSCEVAKAAYHVRSWLWEFWRASLMFNMQCLCVRFLHAFVWKTYKCACLSCFEKACIPVCVSSHWNVYTVW